MDYLLLLSSIVLGAICVFALKLHAPHHVKLLNAFTGAYLLCLTLLHLLPELYHSRAGDSGRDDLRIDALILAGCITQIELTFVSVGIEHGHGHHLHGSMPVGEMSCLSVH